MPKLNQFKLKVETGDVGLSEAVHFTINGHKVPFDDFQGGTGAGETFESGFEIRNLTHSSSKSYVYIFLVSVKRALASF